MTLLIILDALGFIFGVSGAILVGNLNRKGFLAFIFGSLAHGVMGAMQGNWGLATTCFIFIFIDVYYYIRWGKREEK